MSKTQLTVVIAVVIFAILAAARKRDHPAAVVPPRSDHIFSGPDGVAFHIDPEAKTAPNTFVWPATYSSNGHTTKFKIELIMPPPPLDNDKITFGRGRFLAVAGSDSTALITALQRALEAKQVPESTTRADDIPFTFAILGIKQTRGREGGFSSTPSGNWIAMKIFLGSEDTDEAEVYLNLNPREGQAEFSIKDPDYGDNVLRHLITVL